ncbi:MAG: hypothetical protein AB8G23_10230 [Myxococcota bacterium]
MSHGDHSHGFGQFGSRWNSGPSEPESHTEHQAALDATVFGGASAASELVLELDAGELRVRPGASRAE